MAEETPLSKRERQKQRLAQKRAQQRTEARRNRAKRLTTLGLILALILGGSGIAVANWLSNRAEDARLREDALARLDELGCTEDTAMPDLGAAHIENPTLFPPDEIYPDRPTTSGLHLPQWVLTGVYDKVIDERLLVHNLEHGYVNVFYTDDADPADVEALRENAEERIGGGAPKMVVAPWRAEMPGNANFAFVGWRQRQLCERYDEGILLEFLSNHHGLRGRAPEKEARPHLSPGEGIDPNEVEGDLLYPPLGESASDAPSMSDDDGAVVPGGDPTEPAEAGE